MADVEGGQRVGNECSLVVEGSAPVARRLKKGKRRARGGRG